jgi:hypothetical protein
MYTPEVIAAGKIPTDERFRDQVRMEASTRTGLSLEDYIRKMDRAGIERSFLVAVRCGDRRIKGLERNHLRKRFRSRRENIPTGSPAWRASIPRAVSLG